MIDSQNNGLQESIATISVTDGAIPQGIATPSALLGAPGEYDIGEDRFDDDDYPDTNGFGFNDRNIFYQGDLSGFLGMDADAWKGFTKNAGAILEAMSNKQSRKFNSTKGIGAVSAVLGSLKTTKRKHHIAIFPQELSIDPASLPDITKKSDLYTMSSFNGEQFHMSGALAKIGSGLTSHQANKLIDYRRRILKNRNLYSSFDGDMGADFIGFTEGEMHEYADFLGIDFGKIGKAIGGAVGSAAKAVGSAVGTAAKATVHAVGAAGSAVGRAAVWTGGRTLQATKAVGTGLWNGTKYVGRNIVPVLETAGGVALTVLSDGTLATVGGAMIADGGRKLIKDANGGEDVVGELNGEVPTPADQAAAASAATNLAGGAYSIGGSGDMYNASAYNPDPNAVYEGDDYDETTGVDPSQLTAEQLAAYQAQQAAAAEAKKKAKLKKYLMYGAIALVLAVAGYFIWKHYHKHHKK